MTDHTTDTTCPLPCPPWRTMPEGQAFADERREDGAVIREHGYPLNAEMAYVNARRAAISAAPP